jgi:hypothetical protein
MPTNPNAEPVSVAVYCNESGDFEVFTGPDAIENSRKWIKRLCEEYDTDDFIVVIGEVKTVRVQKTTSVVF